MSRLVTQFKGQTLIPPPDTPRTRPISRSKHALVIVHPAQQPHRVEDAEPLQQRLHARTQDYVENPSQPLHQHGQFVSRSPPPFRIVDLEIARVVRRDARVKGGYLSVAVPSENRLIMTPPTTAPHPPR